MPADTDGIIFHSHGCKLLGTLYRPDGKGKKPTVLLLHGIPGNEKNVDLAYVLRDAGWNAVTFHYRGCWGSEGNYSLTGIVDDTIAAIDYLSQRDDVDMARFAVVGLSLGGWGVVAAAARDDRIRAVISINPLVDPNDYVIGDEYAEGFAAMLNGITPKELQSQWMSLTPLQDIASKLANRPTMLITGEADELFSVEHQKVLADALPSIEWWRIPDANHVLGDHRVMLARGIVDWLTKNLEGLQDLQGLALRHPIESDHARVTSVMTEWWGGRDLTSLLPRLYFQHFTDTSFIVEKDGELVAFLVGFMSQSQPHVAYIHFVGVHLDHRKHGLARYLYERFFALTRSRGAREVHCVTASVNTGSIAFHKRMGFEVEEGEMMRFRKRI
jgi:pimeloyl-ACP methyl ester carboxylesterase/GNAT superfamily N-acetyltransferase